MALPVNIADLIRLYFAVVPPSQIGTRLQQIWDGVTQAQRDQIKILIQPLYSRMFTGKLSVILTPTAIIESLATILTGVQQTTIINLMKTDIINIYNSQKATIDSRIDDVNSV
jgi:hypothetical protein